MAMLKGIEVGYIACWQQWMTEWMNQWMNEL